MLTGGLVSGSTGDDLPVSLKDPQMRVSVYVFSLGQNRSFQRGDMGKGGKS